MPYFFKYHSSKSNFGNSSRRNFNDLNQQLSFKHFVNVNLYFKLFLKFVDPEYISRGDLWEEWVNLHLTVCQLIDWQVWFVIHFSIPGTHNDVCDQLSGNAPTITLVVLIITTPCSGGLPLWPRRLTSSRDVCDQLRERPYYYSSGTYHNYSLFRGPTPMA